MSLTGEVQCCGGTEYLQAQDELSPLIGPDDASSDNKTPISDAALVGQQESPTCSAVSDSSVGSPSAGYSISPPQTPDSPDETLAAGLFKRVRALENELRSCRRELHRIQRELNRSKKLHQSSEARNLELRTQVEELSIKINESNTTKLDKTDQEAQTDDYPAWSYADYYYYAAHQTPYSTNAHEAPAQEDGSNCGPDSSIQSAISNPCAEDNLAEYTQEIQVEEGTSLADSLRATAEAAVSQTGFTYDESSGMYYDHSTGFYYDSENQLHYDPTTGIYYYCDVESGRYQFHSRVDLQSYNGTDPQPLKSKRGRKKNREQLCSSVSEDKDLENVRAQNTATSCSTAHDRSNSCESVSEKKKRKLDNYVGSNERESSSSSEESEPEEGEITDSENAKTSSDEDMASGDNETIDSSETEETDKIWPPCIRVIVVRSPVLEIGSLFIITAVKTATIGREKDMGHTIRIPEIGVSKFHAEVYFDSNLQSYVLVDQGSQNGTVINGNQILQPKEVCEPYVLQHGDEVKFGETVLSFHVHPGSETCNGCEPGQVRAHLRLNKKDCSGPILSKEDKEQLRKQGLKQIKVKYGLQSADHEDHKVLMNPKYKDRAGRRRKEVGSEGTFQRDDVPASVHVEINDSNKGRQMLEKMGWKKGEGLGKGNGGMRDPIKLNLRKKKAGLGLCNTSCIEDVQIKTQTKKNWEKARERYAENFPDAKIMADTKNPTSWVKGAAE
ncbi:angiogenic factor with G patch and FHA domains 1 isoform X2 [Bombina bombina]|uniref:angiogenic factor with G patch and FHA domains 1 isoform X2 n=1 Tax=Bombina bombina TaxID=8345 RepID=UPI00235AEC60|nr:angiogenic factor with G patch and FHA domains 1 isoform X2 [Bombina bombina]